MLPVAMMTTSRAPDMVRYGIFSIEFSKSMPTHTVSPVAVCGEVYQQSAFSVNTYPVPTRFRT